MCRTAGSLKAYQEGCEALHTSLNKLFVAAALKALSALSGQSKVTVEWTFNGRDENWKNDLIGLTISSIPVAVDMEKALTARDILREIDTQNELGMRYAELSLGNNGVTPGDRDRLIVVYESGFDMNAFLPDGTEAVFGYDRLNGVFTRFQIILFNSPYQEDPIPYYINYDSRLYSQELVEKYCLFFNEALNLMITEEKNDH